MQKSSLPEWAQWVQAVGPLITALATVVVGIVVGYIAYRQWLTAREKLVLDLFDKRFKVFKLLRTIVSELTSTGQLEDVGATNELVAEGRFLFGPEVTADFEEIHRIRLAFELRKLDASARLDAVFDRLLITMEPYLALRQKLQNPAKKINERSRKR